MSLFFARKNNKKDYIIPFSKLKRMPQLFYGRTDIEFSVEYNGVVYELYMHYIPFCDKAVIFGTGFIGKEKDSFPVFSRSSWAPAMSYTGLWYFDPTVYKGEADLCWGYGTNDHWYLEDIADICREILSVLRIDLSNTLFFGSSGGGYTSLVLATMLRSKAAVINPQWNVLHYWPKAIEALENSVLEPGESLLQDRTDWIRVIQKEGYFPHVHLLQNMGAKADIERHLLPLLSDLAAYEIDCGHMLQIDFYYDPAGHSAMVSKEETLAMIEKNLALTGSASGKEITVTKEKPYDAPDFVFRMMTANIGEIQSTLKQKESEKDRPSQRETDLNIAQIVHGVRFMPYEGAMLLQLDVPVPVDASYAIYLLRPDETRVLTMPYQRETGFVLSHQKPGDYTVKVFVKYKDEVRSFRYQTRIPGEK